MAFFKGQATDYHDFLTILKGLVQDDHISAASVYDGGTGYAIGDTITLSGGTKTHEPEIEVRGISSGDYATGATVAAGGSGYVVGDELYPASGTYIVTPVLEVTSVSGGAVTAVQINNPGICSSQPTNPVTTTSDGSGTGCTINFTWTAGTGIITNIHIADAGVYTTQASNPVSQNTSSGAGTGAKFEVTYTDTAWEVKVDYKAYEATGVVISAAGTGYTLNDIVTVVGGTYTAATTVKITGVSAGVPTSVAIDTEAGNYSTTPSNPASTSGGTGSGLTLTMTWTYQVAENKYLMIHNTTSDQYVGWRAFKETSPETAYVLQCAGFTGFNSLSTPWEQQPGATVASTSSDGTYVPLSGGGSPATVYYWLSVQDLRIVCAFKVASVYPNMYLGGIDTFLTTDEYAYPQLIMGCIAHARPYTYGAIDFAGMNNPGAWSVPGGTNYPGPGVLRCPDGSIKQVANWEQSSGNPVYEDEEINISPSGGTTYGNPAAPNNWFQTTHNWREMFTEAVSIPGWQQALKRVADDFMLLPSVLSSKDYNQLYGNMRGIFGINPDGAITAEDQIYIGSDVYRCFQNCAKSTRNFFFAMKED